MGITSHCVLTFFVFVVFSLANVAAAQPNISDVHQTTTPPADARFEIVQSQLAAKWTFRLDRYTGRVHQLVKTQDGEMAWETMMVEGMTEFSKANKPRFIIFTSGLASRHTFLMDAETGKTWVLRTTTYPGLGEDPFEITGWWPFEQ